MRAWDSIASRVPRDMSQSSSISESVSNLVNLLDDNFEKAIDIIIESKGRVVVTGIYVSPDLGGSGLSRLDSTLIFEGLSQGCTSTAAFLSIHNMATWMIDNFGSQELKERFVPDLCLMKKISSY